MNLHPVPNPQWVPDIPAPTTTTIETLKQVCLDVRVWADQCDDLSEATETHAKVSAIETYLAKKGQAAEAQEAARWLEVRIGELLGPAEVGVNLGNSVATEIPKDFRYEFRRLAEHRDLVARLVPASRHRILEAIRLAEIQPLPDDAGHCLNCRETHATIVIDPPWRYNNTKGTRNGAGRQYPTMTLDELAELHIPANPDAHLYLWVTNSFLRQGFDLIDAWGFNYKTCLTWIKPQIGMGNYFRATTEHVLFATRGRLPIQVKNQRTNFDGDRGRHSAKPDNFYDIVQRCSPQPWLDMFARTRRLDWHTWGNEA